MLLLLLQLLHLRSTKLKRALRRSVQRLSGAKDVIHILVVVVVELVVVRLFFDAFVKLDRRHCVETRRERTRVGHFQANVFVALALRLTHG